MAVITFENWVMFKHGEVCLREEEDFMRNNERRLKKVLRYEDGEGYVDWDPPSNQNWVKYFMEFRQYTDGMHMVHAVCTDVRGQTSTLSIWMTSKQKLSNAHELISHNKLIPIWEKVIGFMKECTTV